MFKKTGNPIVEELCKTYRDRQYNLSNLKIILKDGVRLCAWCGEGKLRSANQKYCAPECSRSAMAWAYPQKEEALGALLLRQDFKCNICQYDYTEIMDKIVAGQRRSYPYEIDDYRTQFAWYVYKWLKSRCPKERRPEVDHIIPISHGGQALGLANHQAICYTCHKAKTRKDNSGPRKVDPERARKAKVKRDAMKVYDKMGEWHRNNPYSYQQREEYSKYLEDFYHSITLEEFDSLLAYEDRYSFESDFKKRLKEIRQKKVDKLNQKPDTE